MMTGQLAAVRVQMRSVGQLRAIVIAMRGIAASRAQQGRALLAGVQAYSETVSHAIGRALTIVPGVDAAMHSQIRAGARGVILFCAEQGFAGAFNERILAMAKAERDRPVTFVIGTRGASMAKERGIAVSWSTAMVTQPRAIAGLANRVAEALYQHITNGTLARVDVVFACAKASRSIEIRCESLIPVDFAGFARPTGREPPIATLEPGVLLERLAAEYVYARLCQAATFTFAAENEARMAVMAAAKTNIETKLKEFAERERRLRQEDITAEVVELAAGTEALKGAAQPIVRSNA